MAPIFDWKNKINKDELKKVIEFLKSDGLVIVPTETVYGLAANGFSDEACSKIFKAKGRAQDNPLIIHVSDIEMIDKITEPRTEIEQKLIENFMPGPFTLILNKKDVICDTATCGGKTVGIRMPSNPIIHEIISKSGIAIAAPSANISGRPSGTNISDIYGEFKNKVDAFVDGGDSTIGIESTVVKVIDGVPTILRPGFVTEDDIKRVCGKVKLSDKLFNTVSSEEKVESPGMKYRHYAPRTKCELVEYGRNQITKINEILAKNKNKKICIMGFTEDRDKFDIAPELYIDFGSKKNISEISQNIFTDLRKIDKLNCNIAIIEGLKKKNLGLSIMNRLVRACDNNII